MPQRIVAFRRLQPHHREQLARDARVDYFEDLESVEDLLLVGHRPLATGLLLEATQRRLAGQHAIGIDRSLQGDIAAQGVVIVEVLVAQRQAKDALPKHGLRPVLATASGPSIIEAARDGTGQPHLAIELAKQQDTAIGGDLAPVETGGDLAAFTAWKPGFIE